MLTTFDLTFDYTFARALVVTTPSFPEVGGDGGARVPASALPFSTNPNQLPSCFQPSKQGWERWGGVPMSTPDYLLPFVAVVPLPDNVQSSVYCQGPFAVVDADSGEPVIVMDKAPLHYLTDANYLYILHSGSSFVDTAASGQPTALLNGTYRIQIGPAGVGLISEPFTIRCECRLLRVRLLNDTRIGDLLYGQYGFQQIFYVDGDLTGPTYEETETRSGSEKTGGTVKKIWTLSLTDVSESVADALAHAGIHRLVEVSIIHRDGSFNRPIQAMAYQAKSKVTARATGGFDVELTLPVRETTWGTSSADAASCRINESASGVLVDIECAPVLTP